jgi:hypothetical protein
MKKVFEGMTPPQIWEYIKNLPIEEREKLLFNELLDEDMKKMTKKGPQYLVGIEFNIPLFAADKQIYRCIDVSEIATSPGGKDYNIMLSEIKTLNYNVPERVDINLFVPVDGGGMVRIHMIEVHPERGDLPLSNTITLKENISSLGKLKGIFYNMGKKI